MTGTRLASALAVTASLALGLAAWAWRTGAVGGSDSACYALMAQAFARGQAMPHAMLALEAPWPDATRVAAPGGFLPSETVPGAAVPVCAPGYSLLVAPLVRLAGPGTIHAVPPVAAAALVWLAYLAGRQLGSAWAGAGAAVLTAAHPIVWFQAVQPMNDVTSAAVWLGAAVAAIDGRAWTTGALTGLGLLVRPNLAPAAVATTLVCAAEAFRGRRAPRDAFGAIARVSAGALPGIALVLVLNAVLYGSPFRSGYGDLGSLFALSHVPPNLARYGTTWIATSTPMVVLGMVAPLLVPAAARPRAWALVATAAALSVVYLVYRPFPEWWYLRFLLPAVVMSLALACGALVTLGARASGPTGVAAAMAVVALWATWTLRAPEAAEARRLRRLESRFGATASAVAQYVPREAAAITGWQSGPIRFGPGHEVVMWDALDPAWLDRAIAWLADRGAAPVIVLETWEEAPFRARFAGQVFGALDWPPRYEIERRVRVYRPEDRAAFLGGAAVPTEVIRGERPGRGR